LIYGCKVNYLDFNMDNFFKLIHAMNYIETLDCSNYIS